MLVERLWQTHRGNDGSHNCIRILGDRWASPAFLDGDGDRSNRGALHAMTEDIRAHAQQHIGWLKQFIQGMDESNWRDMKLRAERQLEEWAVAPAQDENEQPVCYVPYHHRYHWRPDLAANDEQVATAVLMRLIESAAQQGWSIRPLYAAPRTPAGSGTPGCADPNCSYASEPPAVSKLTGVDLLRAFAEAFRSGAQGADMDCNSAKAMAEAIDQTLSQVETARAQALEQCAELADARAKYVSTANARSACEGIAAAIRSLPSTERQDG